MMHFTSPRGTFVRLRGCVEASEKELHSPEAGYQRGGNGLRAPGWLRVEFCPAEHLRGIRGTSERGGVGKSFPSTMRKGVSEISLYALWAKPLSEKKCRARSLSPCYPQYSPGLQALGFGFWTLLPEPWNERQGSLSYGSTPLQYNSFPACGRGWSSC